MTKQLRSGKLWKNGAFSAEKEVEKKEIQKTQKKETKRRRASMLLLHRRN